MEDALLSIYRTHPHDEGISTVIWALTKTFNPSHRPLFLHHTEWAMRQLMSAYANLSQAVGGLQGFSRPDTFSDNRGSIMAEAIDLADAYLKDEGILIPF